MHHEIFVPFKFNGLCITVEIAVSVEAPGQVIQYAASIGYTELFRLRPGQANCDMQQQVEDFARSTAATTHTIIPELIE